MKHVSWSLEVGEKENNCETNDDQLELGCKMGFDTMPELAERDIVS